ncbi:DUF6455 family protein [Tabrizicola sp. J26]|uniref:DUF6455 family protein n=1 Tax=Alitabrizicola rongguiensis TaxID=2909234 RepID=UPI001F44256E|nr:DUF6455 family protein [Tabrizicola rongguiensis]MCF1707384.1 DUF6455 family protein [Tabrizicola rongguiensis]
MIGNVEMPHAFWLTIGMARKVGLNLQEALVEGWLTRRDLTQMVDGCTSCAHHVSCTRWLAMPGEAPLPAYCQNKPRLEAIQFRP